MSEAMLQTRTIEGPVRTRRGKKRLVFQPPRQVPSSVRLLWESAAPEERTRAHATCVAILSMWLGRKTRQQVAQELELPPLRVWQLSQAGLSGMLAGLLKQPRGRGKGLSMESNDEDPRVLKKRISELEAENRSLRDLVEVLKTLPSAREQPASRPRKKPETKTHARKAEVQRGVEGPGGTPARGAGEAPPR
jgi:hypothetical protein